MPEVTDVLVVAAEVREAMSGGTGVVALETSVIGQGLPSPRNEECVRRMDAAIRDGGGVPAWIGAIDGRLVVGLDAVALERFCTPGADADVSADLLELALVGYGVDRLPFFLTHEAPVELEHRVDSAAAAMLAAALALGIRSTLLLCDPVPAAHAMDAEEVADAAASAEGLADAAGAFGQARTPFLLAALAELTDGRRLEANLALLEENARVAGRVATALASA